MWVLTLAAFLTGVSAFAATQLPPEGCVKLLRDARIAGMLGNGAEQEKMLATAVREYPKEILPLLAYADFERAKGPSGAGADFRALLRKRLADPEALVPFSALARMVEDPKASPQDLSTYRDGVQSRLDRTPDDARLLDMLALLHARLGQMDAAADAMTRLHAVQPTRSTAIRCLDFSYQTGRWEAVLSLAREIRSKYEGDSGFELFAAMALLNLGRPDEARKEIAPMMSDPAWRKQVIFSVLLPAGWTLWDQGRAKEAEAVFREAASAEPAIVEPKAILENLFASPEERRALADAQRERLARITDPGHLFDEGTKRLVAGDAAGASDLLKRATDADPAYEIAWFNRGVAAIKLGNWDEARAAFTRSVELKPERAESFLYLGNALARLGRCAEAVPALERALALRPGLKEAQNQIESCRRKPAQPERTTKEQAPATNRE